MKDYHHLTEKNSTARVSWCYERKNWTVDEEWNYIIFSDETKVVLDKDRKIYVWRKSDEAWRPECLGLYSDHSPRKNVSAMFWGCISYNGIGTLTPLQGTVQLQWFFTDPPKPVGHKIEWGGLKFNDHR